MQIVIDIPKEVNESIENGSFGAKYNIYDLCGFIMNGKALGTAIEALEQEPKWIPVTERLPKYSGEYLVTVRNVEDKDYLYIDMSWFAHPTDYDIESGEWREVMGYEEVIAWQPLPEPYEEGAEQ